VHFDLHSHGARGGCFGDLFTALLAALFHNCYFCKLFTFIVIDVCQ
jgi:hypothetical protein